MVSVHMMVFWVSRRVLYCDYRAVSEERPTSIFKMTITGIKITDRVATGHYHVTNSFQILTPCFIQTGFNTNLPSTLVASLTPRTLR
jgi:hypothetical protein